LCHLTASLSETSYQMQPKRLNDLLLTGIAEYGPINGLAKLGIRWMGIFIQVMNPGV